MTIDELYDDALRCMASTLASFAKRVRPPLRAPYKDGFVFGYTERTIELAIVQKVARLIGEPHAARMLLDRGFFSEQAAGDIALLEAMRRYRDECEQRSAECGMEMSADELARPWAGRRPQKCRPTLECWTMPKTRPKRAQAEQLVFPYERGFGSLV